MMISVIINLKLIDNLIHIQNELNSRETSKQDLTKKYIANRLNKSLVSYRSDLETRLKYLNQRKPENVLKGM